MKNPAKSFKDLVVWQKAHQFVLDIYQFTKLFPDDERFGLISQIRRAAVSVAANIAEGFRKRGANDKARFFNIAQGSLDEVHYYLILSGDLGYGESQGLNAACDEVARLLNSYSNAVLDSHSSLLTSHS